MVSQQSCYFINYKSREMLFSSLAFLRHGQLLTHMDHMLHMDKFSETGFQAECVKLSQVFLSSLS